MASEKREYIAIVIGGSMPGGRLNVAVEAENLSEARRLLEEKYGTGSIFDLHNEDDADKPR